MANASSIPKDNSFAIASSSISPYFSIAILTIATFMEVLDLTITNVAVPRIAGDLGVSFADASWVIGSYLVANAAILPISGWLATRYGRKQYYMACVCGFVASSLMCGLSTNLGMLIFFRFLQGVSGSGLAVSEQAIIADAVPPEKLGRAFSIYASFMFIAPVLGPTVGGFITDSFSWHWVFFINVPIGIVSLVLVYFFVFESDAALEAAAQRRAEHTSIDWIGILLFVGGVACLELVLEQGPKEGWFESNLILLGAIAAFFALLIGTTWEWYQEHPAVDIEMFKHRHFAASCVLMFAIAVVIYGATFLIPYAVQSLLDYTATNAGLVLLPGALVSLIMMPIVGYLLDIMDARKVILFGLAAAALALWHLSSLNLNVSFADVATARAFQSFGVSFLAASVNTVAYYNLPKGKNNSASSLLNLIRNTGASMSVALTVTLIRQRTETHAANLSDHASKYNPNFMEAIRQMTQTFREQGLNALQAKNLSYDKMWETIVKQASMKAVLEVFEVFMILFILAMPLVFLLKGKRDSDSAAGH